MSAFKLIDETMEINFDRPSKFYEPGEKVTGILSLPLGKFSDLKGPLSIRAESYMDTVSAIRGNMGRQALPENERTYFMKKDVEMGDPTGIGKQRPFHFVAEATEVGEKLIDSYVGVDFSIVYEVIAIYTDRIGKPVTAKGRFEMKCPGAGLDILHGKKLIPQEFEVSNENLEANAVQKTLPKFKFSGVITTVNCCFTEPFDGYIKKSHCDLQIKSVEIQLVRVETFEGKTNATEV